MAIRAVENAVPAAASGLSAESRRIRDDVDAALHTAISALNNDRFRMMLEQITDPRPSTAAMSIGGDKTAVEDCPLTRSQTVENKQ
ncbi:hypothetical protein [Mesorhizobium helmanticense]|uniref:hypothetical protein n=1 Tax=Mesorhizobium helmanticense TaxID=1776423 RepID=UPI001FE0BE5A|nr:hypothetical protein [Mesorhizobium helmanticense]